MGKFIDLKGQKFGTYTVLEYTGVNQKWKCEGEVMVDDFIVNREEHYGWCNNLKGFIPYRYFIDNNLTF